MGHINILLYTDGLCLCKVDNHKLWFHSGTAFGLVNYQLPMPLNDDTIKFIITVMKKFLFSLNYKMSRIAVQI